MEIKGQRILVLGGAGLVGEAVCRNLMRHRPASISISALTKNEALSAIEKIKGDADRVKVALDARWGDIFVSHDLSQKSRKDILRDAALRRQWVGDILAPFSLAIKNKSALYQMVKEIRPDCIIDCINTATAVAYQNVFEESRAVYAGVVSKKSHLDPQSDHDDLHARIETLIGSQYIPQLIRHVQLLWSSLSDWSVKAYVKVGTTGTGGLGLDLPYTHSEEHPSALVMAKASVAGAHSMMLFLLARTGRYTAQQGQSSKNGIQLDPQPFLGPLIKEIKPATMIAWRRTRFGKIYHRGTPLPLYDCLPEKASSLEDVLHFFSRDSKKGHGPVGQGPKDNGPDVPWSSIDGKFVEAPYVDSGENGAYGLAEFEAITDQGRMEFITPEEVAAAVEWELCGAGRGKDIIAQLDAGVLGPSYRAGYLRDRVVHALQLLEDESGIPSIGFENLGPPRVSKLLYEAWIVTRIQPVLESQTLEAEELSQRCAKLIAENDVIRRLIISIRLAIILPDGRILHGPALALQPPSSSKPFSDELMDKCAEAGWVDLRVRNIARWQKRLAQIHAELENDLSTSTGSRTTRGHQWWAKAASGTQSIGQIVSWIISKEDGGERLKP